MRYTAKQYARAFTALVREGKLSEKDLVGKFAALIEKNGDMPQRDKIAYETDRELRREHGKRTVLLETARPIKGLEKKLKGFTTKTDVVENKINPSLIAGVRITVDDEDQFDGTLARKLQVLFKEA